MLLSDLRAFAAKNLATRGAVDPEREPVVDPDISGATLDLVNQVQTEADVTKLRRRLTLFRKNDAGYAEARLIATKMIVDLSHAMGVEHARGGRLQGAWLTKKLAQRAYQRITMTDLFEAWARRTAERMDDARVGASS